MKRFFLFLLLVGAAFPMKAGAEAEKGLLFRLLEKTAVVGPDLSLGDVADVIGPNRAVLDKLRRVNLGRAPAVGVTLKLTESFVKIALRREGYSLDSFVFDGPPVVEVVTQSQEMSTAGLLPEVKDFILKATEKLRKMSKWIWAGRKRK